MDITAAARIRDWFSVHGDDGEFAFQTQATPYTLICPADQEASIVYTTKTSAVAAALLGREHSGVGMIGRYGLPSASEMTFLRTLCSNHRLDFLGDMDPVDLLIFAALRGELSACEVRHLGVSDSYLKALALQVPSAYWMQCSGPEVESLTLLRDVLPEYRSLLGPSCAEMIDRGTKLELEAIVSVLGSRSSLVTGEDSRGR